MNCPYNNGLGNHRGIAPTFIIPSPLGGEG